MFDLQIVEEKKQEKIGETGKAMGREISSSARRAAPRLKLLAGKIAQGANRVI